MRLPTYELAYSRLTRKRITVQEIAKKKGLVQQMNVVNREWATAPVFC